MTHTAISYNPDEGRYDMPWGWVKLNFQTGDIQVYGPGVEEWFDAQGAAQTASYFMGYTNTTGEAVALAIHQQYAAWKGARSLMGGR